MRWINDATARVTQRFPIFHSKPQKLGKWAKQKRLCHLLTIWRGVSRREEITSLEGVKGQRLLFS
jgi:hypothetical protein